MQHDRSSRLTTNSTDSTADAYAKWVLVHQALTEAEQHLSLLPADSSADLKAAAFDRVETLRAESEALLQAAQAQLRARGR